MTSADNHEFSRRAELKLRPLLVLDLVGTTIFPNPDPATVYTEAAAKHGLSLDRSEIASRFSEAMRSASFIYPPDGATSEEVEREFWRMTVANVFAKWEENTTSIFEALWNHFAEPTSWSIYPDAEQLLLELSKSEIDFVFATNFDTRVERVLQGLGLTHDSNRLFWSAQVGINKRAPSFYRELSCRLGVEPRQLLVIGDDFQNDFVAPTQAGARSCWLNRHRAKPPHEVGAMVWEVADLMQFWDEAKLI